MKVTVCFGSVRVVVPCGSGDFPIGELIDKAVVRYRKAIGQGSDYWVTVHNLKSSNDSGILDPDDLLSDVADDREQIVAIFEEQGVPHHHNGGDGTSSSSVGTSSPDIFNGGRHGPDTSGPQKDFAMVPPFARQTSKTDVIITANDHSNNSGSSMLVRHSSESVLNQISKDYPTQLTVSQIDPRTPSDKRWPINSIKETDKDVVVANDNTVVPSGERQGGNGQERDDGDDEMSFSTFARSSSRKSLTNNAVMYKWLDAQEKQQDRYEQQQELAARKEPLGSAGHKDDFCPLSPGPMSPVSHIVTLPKSSEPLGIHVVPVTDTSGKHAGLMVDSIEETGRAYRDGRLKPEDHIVEINGTSLMGVNFIKAQEIFKREIQSDELRLRVQTLLNASYTHQPSSSSQSAPPSAVKAQLASPTRSFTPPITPVRSHHKQASLDESVLSSQNTSTPLGRRLSSPLRSRASGSSHDEQKDLSPKRSPPAIPPRAPTTSLTSSKGLYSGVTNTRQIGKKIEIELTKGGNGLGFSITTRDNPTRGTCPIYIKNIMPKGAAVEDGRLKSGDRLLEVNGEEVTGMTQADVVNILRKVQSGSQVTLMVSRQVTEEVKAAPTEMNNNLPNKVQTSTSSLPAFPVSTPPGETPSPQEGDTGILGLLGGRNREIHKMELPLHDAGSSGLGVSVKGKTTNTERGMQDLGIYIKSVLPGGAAAKEGCLVEEDQLIEVNGVSLLGKTNQEAMNILRTALQKEGPTPGKISIVISRRKALPAKPREMKISLSDTTLIDHKLRTPSTSSSNTQNPTPTEEVQSAFKPPLPVKQDNKTAANAQNLASNPVIERLTGNQLRNVSYQRANHDSILSDSTFFEMPQSPVIKSNFHKPTSLSSTQLFEKTPQKTSDATSNQLRQVKSEVKARPLSAIELRKTVPDVAATSQETEENIGDDTALVLELDKQNKDVVEDSMISPEGEDAPFQRDGFGRQSMSEKRKGHADPSSSEFYQKVKQNKDNRIQYSETWDSRRSAFRRVEGILREEAEFEEQDAGTLLRASSAESLLSQNVPAHNKRGSTHERVMKFIHEDIDPAELVQAGDRDSKSSKRSSVNSTGGKPKEVGPMLGLKKSSSLESLQTAVHEVSIEAESLMAGGRVSVIRGRGCNESFRAAVDHSYEENGAEAMETVDEEGSEAGSNSVGGIQSRGSSFNNHDLELKKVPKKTKDKDKSLFKGFGQMFRFGKARKADDKAPRKANDLQKVIPLQKEEDYIQSNKKNLVMEKSKSDSQLEQEKAAEQQRKRMLEKQELLKQQDLLKQQEKLRLEAAEREQDALRKLEVQRFQDAQRHYFNQEQIRLHEQHKHESQSHLVTNSGYNSVPVTPSSKMSQSSIGMPPPHPSSTQKPGYREDMPPPREPPPAASRAEKIQFLRAEHQRRHRERQGQYPRDDEEEKFERQMQQFETPKMVAQDGYSDYPLPPRRRSEEPFDRPSSRLGYQDTNSYSHYANLQEIQEQLHRHDYYQRQYHSQYPPPVPNASLNQPFHTPHHQRPPPYDAARSAQGHVASHASRADSYYRETYMPPAPATDSRYDPRHNDQTSRSHSQPPHDSRSRGHDPRSWGQGYDRPSAMSPPRQVPSQTPINQLNYYPHQNKSLAVSASSLHNPSQFDPRTRTYSDFDDPRSAYGLGYGHEPQFGSLPRRRETQRDSRLMSGSSAQV